ncbi:ATP-binding cassette domain-containing protein [Ideonella azotifigens]|uniref:amino acid ABC transporter ATP-binding/permease protein n=1 Tax=Ideonella azotifigens TaxID=513160 RepID=UPI001E3940DD|nr:ATP-binding cassette domain-containing protein [Ideonella azotifigens]MCD2341048.1 ATP-binding cassette domain-containing protein [Ideonella azotifigens]
MTNHVHANAVPAPPALAQRGPGSIRQQDRTGPAGSPLRQLLATERRRHSGLFQAAAACAALLGLASVALLGVSGWFITAAAAAGVSGLAMAQAFNYLLPSAAIRLLAIARTGARYGERLCSHEAALRSLARVRPAIFGALCAAPAERSLAVSTGEAVTAMVQDVEAIEAQQVRRSVPWTAAAGVLTGLALLAFGGWPPLVATLGCGALLVLAGGFGARRVRSAAQASRAAMGALKDELAWLSAHDAELHCHDLAAWAGQRVVTQDQALAKAQRRQLRLMAGLDAVLALASGFTAALAFALARGAGAPVAALCALAAVMTVESLAPLLRHALQQASAHEAERRLDALLGSAQALPSPAPADSTPASTAAALHLPALSASPLQPGEHVALLGPSGCGKSTLLETLLGLRPAVRGTAELAGHDLADLPVSTLRAQFAWLPQDAALLAGSVRDNLTLGCGQASDEQLWAALQDAGLDRRIRALPGGLDGWLGEDGAGLSGGERRRLALARACLVPAPWLLLDEPTEGLDAATEAAVVAGLRRRLSLTGQGLLLVSHRPAPLALCNRQLMLGRLQDSANGLEQAGFEAVY